ncbi:hypothetical protein B0G93_11549 [Bacillus sp. V-88]|jgi:hypothetical protein|nr:hypothetical protein B0G93_11549 [Bacillus sp. V-88]SLK23718.1 hypothetical protein SAMN06295884_11549 [Bacillus sp. V-88]
MKIRFKYLLITILLLFVESTFGNLTYADDELPDPRVGDNNIIEVVMSTTLIE